MPGIEVIMSHQARLEAILKANAPEIRRVRNELKKAEKELQQLGRTVEKAWKKYNSIAADDNRRPELKEIAERAEAEYNAQRTRYSELASELTSLENPTV